ncbi:MAG TPA: nucleotide exchange factor GrpE [Solirubrobacteraceae bacterium]|jgi:molecular chaperone GrpE|nr:nucleotide exchange factor GrpE [Solirubrobacteraceae bacterium]
MTDTKRTSQERADSSPGAKAPGEETVKGSPGAEAADGGAAQAANPQHGCGVEVNGGGAEVAGDLDELVKTAAERDEYLALAQRTQADFENYRKRVARESTSAQARGAVMLVKELLPALDNLDRALEAAAKDDPLLDGVRIVRSELTAALARTGIESFSPAGEPFDPAVHEAVATSEQQADGAAAGTVVEVYQPGYRFGETIIRPARVVVAA